MLAPVILTFFSKLLKLSSRSILLLVAELEKLNKDRDNLKKEKKVVVNNIKMIVNMS